jgi:hypothetical protein
MYIFTYLNEQLSCAAVTTSVQRSIRCHYNDNRVSSVGCHYDVNRVSSVLSAATATTI